MSSLSSSGSEFQTIGPATEMHDGRVYCVDDVARPAGDDVPSAVAGDRTNRLELASRRTERRHGRQLF